jgi:hypothetical protein
MRKVPYSNPFGQVYQVCALGKGWGSGISNSYFKNELRTRFKAKKKPKPKYRNLPE